MRNEYLFLGSWGMNQSTEQIARELLHGSWTDRQTYRWMIRLLDASTRPFRTGGIKIRKKINPYDFIKKIGVVS